MNPTQSATELFPPSPPPTTNSATSNSNLMPPPPPMNSTNPMPAPSLALPQHRHHHYTAPCNNSTCRRCTWPPANKTEEELFRLGSFESQLGLDPNSTQDLCFKYRPSRQRYRLIFSFLPTAGTKRENRSPYCLQQKTADI